VKRIPQSLGILLCLAGLVTAQNIVPAEKQNPATKAAGVCAQPESPNLQLLLAKQIATDLGCQQLRIWTSPKQLGRRDVLFPVLAFAGLTAGAIAVDSTIAHHFEQSTAAREFRRGLNGEMTKYGIVALPFAFYGASLLKHDAYGQQTAIEAGEALLDAELLTKSLKAITGRPGPNLLAQRSGSSGPWFTGNSGSFPSGHAAGAFAVASVFARRYQSHKWVPYLAFGMAAAIAASTVATSGHYTSDVLVGSALGFGIGQFAVRHHEIKY
jgi:hypothetical protein